MPEGMSALMILAPGIKCSATNRHTSFLVISNHNLLPELVIRPHSMSRKDQAIQPFSVPGIGKMRGYLENSISEDHNRHPREAKTQIFSSLFLVYLNSPR